MSNHAYVDPWGRDPGFVPDSVEVKCAVCHRTYSVRADSPGWSSVWTCCISCQANEENEWLNDESRWLRGEEDD